MKKTLTPEQEEKLIALATSGRSAWQKGDIEKAEKEFLASWEIIPEPKADYNRTQSASYGITSFYRDTGQLLKAKQWLEQVKAAYGSGVAQDEYISFLTATIHYEAGEFDEAYKLFSPQYKIYGARAFEGAKKEYLEFTKNYKRK